MNNSTPETSKKRFVWLYPVVFLMTACVIVVLSLLGVSILERRWESQLPPSMIQPIAEWQPDNSVWGANFPRQYESYLKTKITDTQTLYGGAVPRDYLADDPRKIILYAGYPFSKDYKQARGHYYALEDVLHTRRIASPFQAGTCMTCKSTDVPRLMNQMGLKEFYASNFHDLKQEVTHPIGCTDCHEPNTMNLRITRPALLEALTAMGTDPAALSHQQMRSLVCAQCHVEYYFQKEPKNYLTFPWKNGLSVENMLEYYDNLQFTDYVHAISKTPIVKAQHPDYELYSAGVHAYQNVACADCHMPYRTEGAVKFTDHHVQSPLLNIANSCAVCHRWPESEIRSRVESIQNKVRTALLQAEDALVKAHFDIAAALQAGAADADLTEARTLVRHAQFRWDFLSSNNGVGFHAPQESMRLAGESANQAQQARLLTARILAGKGFHAEPVYPDLSTAQNASKLLEAWKENRLPSLIAK